MSPQPKNTGKGRRGPLAIAGLTVVGLLGVALATVLTSHPPTTTGPATLGPAVLAGGLGATPSTAARTPNRRPNPNDMPTGASVDGGMASSMDIMPTTMDTMPGESSQQPTGQNGMATGDTVYLAATLVGANGVPKPGGDAVGDPNGHATEVVRVRGNQVCFAVRWKGIGAPTMAHLHAGAAGTNGPVKVALFGATLPDTLRAAAGCVTVDDQAALAALTATPESYYVNLHTAQFPGGAIRGQLHRLNQPVNLHDFVRRVADGYGDGNAADTRVASGAGAQEIPGPGDPKAQFLAAVEPNGAQLGFNLSWTNLAPPTEGHIHRGGVLDAGPVVVPLFATPAGLPGSLFAVSGVVANLDTGLGQQIETQPTGFYVNLHNGNFPKGAARGGLFDKNAPKQHF